MIRGENIRRDECELFHLLVVGFVHGTFEAHVDEFVGEV